MVSDRMCKWLRHQCMARALICRDSNFLLSMPTTGFGTLLRLPNKNFLPLTYRHNLTDRETTCDIRDESYDGQLIKTETSLGMCNLRSCDLPAHLENQNGMPVVPVAKFRGYKSAPSTKQHNLPMMIGKQHSPKVLTGTLPEGSCVLGSAAAILVMQSMRL